MFKPINLFFHYHHTEVILIFSRRNEFINIIKVLKMNQNIKDSDITSKNLYKQN